MSSGGTIAVTGLKKVPIHLQSAQTRTVIKGGRIVNDDRSFIADIYMEDGLIKQVGDNLTIPGGTKSIDARGKLVIPGGIDARTCFEAELNGAASADDFYWGTKSALAGGTTMIVNVALGKPDQSLTESYQKWRDAGDSLACCDFGLHVAVPKFDDRAKEEMAVICRDGGVNSFKLMLGYPDMCDLSDADIYRFFSECRNLGAVAGVNLGNGAVTKLRAAELAADGITGPEGILLASPEEMEADSISRAASLAYQANCPLLVDNVYSRASLDVLSNARRNGILLFADTITAALAKDGNAYYDKNWEVAAHHLTIPPLRPDPSLGADLLKRLACGDLTMTSSDHRPFTSLTRLNDVEEFLNIPHGVQGVEQRMRIIWEKGVNQGLIDHCRFVAITSATAAKVLNIYPKKGRIAVGSDADLVIWDPKKKHTISASNQNQQSKYSIYEGITCTGGPEMVLSNGRIVLDEDGLHVSQGAGSFVTMETNGLFTNLTMNQRERNRKDLPRLERGKPDIPKPSAEPPKPLVEKDDEIGVPATKRQTVKVSNPPGGRTSFQW